MHIRTDWNLGLQVGEMMIIICFPMAAPNIATAAAAAADPLPDVITAMLRDWCPRRISIFALEVLPPLLAMSERVPGEFETLFADTETLPGFLIDPTWAERVSLANLLRGYRSRLDDEQRQCETALFGIRCVTLLLYAFDSRMRKFVWADHDVHAILGTSHIDASVRTRHIACGFTTSFKQHAYGFMTNLAAAFDEHRPDAVQHLARHFCDTAYYYWVAEAERRATWV